MNKTEIAIVILNWNGWRDTLECLDSLYKITYPNYEVIVVDNGSTDDSVERIKQWAKENDKLLKLIEFKKNLGFARGNNAGIKYAIKHHNPEYILILNNDTTVKPDFLTPMLEVYNQFPEAGLVGPKVIDYYTGVHWQGVFRKRINFLERIMFLTPLRRIFVKTPISKFYLLKDKNPERVYVVGGCCMLCKTSVLSQIGLFDEKTFLGMEEYILAEKLLKNGYHIYAAPQSIIFHKIGQDTKRIEPAEKTLTFLKSEIYFQRQYLNMSYLQKLIFKIIWLIIYLSLMLGLGSYRKQFKRFLKILFEWEN